MHRRSKILLSLLLATAVIVAGALYYMHHFQVGIFRPSTSTTGGTPNKVNSINYSKPTTDEQQAGNDIKSSVTPKVSDTTNQNPSTPSAISMDITSATQSGSTYYVRAVINTLSTVGSCSLQMTGPNGASYSAQADVQAMASSTTCKGFNIPMSSLTKGDWVINVSFKDGAETASATKKVSI